MVRVSGSAELARPRRGLATREAALLLIAAAGAWAGTVTLACGRMGMSGTMGMELAVFVPVWTLMMAAMLLPSVTPVAVLYAKTVQANRAVRIAGLVAGYLGVWAASGLPAYGLAWLAGWLTGEHPGTAHVLAVAVLARCGGYPPSSPQDPSLAPSRPPPPPLLHHAP